MELVRGSVGDRPWGMTLGALGVRALTGQITLYGEDGKRYWIAFERGIVIAAQSPLASDSAARVALTTHLLTSSQVGEVARQLAAQPARDELAVLAETARLSEEQQARLRHRLVAQRAARTFSIDRGEFRVDDEVTLPAAQNAAVDIREIIYLGVRMNLSQTRLTDDLRVFGTHFALKLDAAPDLPRYGFGDAERAVIDALRGGTTLPELERTHRELDPRTIHAIIYALVSGQSMVVTGRSTTLPAVAPRVSSPIPGRTASGSIPPEVTRAVTQPSVSTVRMTPSKPMQAVQPPADSRARTTGSIPAVQDPAAGSARTPTPNSPGMPALPRAASGNRPVMSRASSQHDGAPPPIDAPSPRPAPPPAQLQPAPSKTRTTSDPALARARSERGNPLVARARTTTARRLEALIAGRIALLDQGGDHFAVLGLPFDAPGEEVRAAYFELAKQLQPDQLVDLGISDEGGLAARLFMAANTALIVLTDPLRRAEYLASLKKVDTVPTRSSVAADPPAAAEAARRGDMAMRRDEPAAAAVELQRAVDLDPANTDYPATLAWVQFCASLDKNSIAADTRKALELALRRSDKPILARFYLGRVERMLGRDREALRHFNEVIDLKPNHAEAASEIRAIEARMKKR